MKVEISGICEAALEKLAEAYNQETMALWEQYATFIRPKKRADTILSDVILEYLSLKHPKLFAELKADLEHRIDELRGQTVPAADKEEELMDCLGDLGRMMVYDKKE